MTDKPDPEAIDINATVARYFTEQAEHNLRAEALRPATRRRFSMRWPPLASPRSS